MMQVNRQQFDTILRSYYDQTQQNLTVEELVKYLERGGYRLSFDESEMDINFALEDCPAQRECV